MAVKALWGGLSYFSDVCECDYDTGLLSHLNYHEAICGLASQSFTLFHTGRYQNLLPIGSPLS